MQNLHWKILIVVVALLLSVFSLTKEGIRLGKDLQGGLSLVYQVTIPDNSDPGQAMAQVIEVIKDRLNPQGVLDISIVQQGRDRIEIVMPLPSKEVQELKQKRQELVEKILAVARIDETSLELALQAGNAVEQFAPETESEQRQAIVDLQNAWDDAVAARATYEAAKANAETDPAQLAAAEQSLAEADVTYERLLADVLRRSIRQRDIERMLQLSTERQKKIDPRTNEVELDDEGMQVYLDSPRDVAVAQLKQQFPYLSEDVDKLIEANDEYIGSRRGLDDPEDLKRLMRGAGVLEFRIAVESGTYLPANDLRDSLAADGPEARTDRNVLWARINDLKQWYEEPQQLNALLADPVSYFAGRRLEAGVYGGEYYLLLWDTYDKKLTHEREFGDWALIGTGRTVDNLGRPAVSFRLDSPGGIEMSRLTGANTQSPMAIVLDGQVYSAPNINQQIGSNGIIMGNFADQELRYLTRVLAAGSLESRISSEPIAQNQIGPTLGADNLRRGLEACVWGVIAVAFFMLLYYFAAGGVATLALICNAVLIFGIMAMQQASFTLPGIAGIVLTIGMAVDANVLIYERIREEMFAGEEDLRTCIRLGYQKALSTIIDGNVTNLIVCVVLYQTATAEVKGFALTLGLGILATLFTALFMTRIVFTIYTEVLKRKTLPMLATVVPAVHRALEPNINWIGLRKLFVPASVVVITLSIIMVSSRGKEMYDTEFRGGMSMTFRTKALDDTQPDGPHVMLERANVEERVHAIGEEAVVAGDPILSAFRTASVVAGGSSQEGTLSDTFVVKIAADSDVIEVGDLVRWRDADDTFSRGTVESVDGDTVMVLGSNQTEPLAHVRADLTLVEKGTGFTDRIVNALVAAFENELGVTRPYEFSDSEQNLPPGDLVFEVTSRSLSDVIRRPGYPQSVSRYDGGVAIVIEGLNPPATIADVQKRVERTRQHQNYLRTAERQWEVIGLAPAADGSGFESVVVLVRDPDYLFQDNAELWRSEVQNVEWRLVREALTDPAQLEQVSSFSSAVAQTLAANAIIAVVLSIMGILVYIWIRFGSLRYSFAAIVALVHDVTIALGALAATHILFEGAPGLAAALGLEDFRIDLGVVAALLTIIGYSLNDTIVIMDRIRENRGKVPLASAKIVNRSINQTISRTVLTSGTTLLAVFIMYVAGGSGIRPFAFCLLAGIIVGSYSSVAIAAPLVFKRSRDEDKSAGLGLGSTDSYETALAKAEE